MKATIFHSSGTFQIDLSDPLDISIPLRDGAENPNAWYMGPPQINAVENGDFVGDVKRGGSVNFRNIFFNPHAHGTHTECVGHISAEPHDVQKAFDRYFFLTTVLSVTPQKLENGDEVITRNQVEKESGSLRGEAIVIRTLPNNEDKRTRQYSHTNPPYVEAGAMEFLITHGVRHFLIDLPSVDKEKDEGRLQAHKAFWEHPENSNLKRTITEFVYVPDTIKDGTYLMNLQIANFSNDASPSRPVLYSIEP